MMTNRQIALVCAMNAMTPGMSISDALKIAEHLLLWLSGNHDT